MLEEVSSPHEEIPGTCRNKLWLTVVFDRKGLLKGDMPFEVL
jgi:hypothetical protein